jgi:hypothetical protein
MRQTRKPGSRQQPLIKHEHHPVVIKSSTKLAGQCYYYCTKCKVWVAWLSKKDSVRAQEMGIVK